jgi:hypothetical protein
MTAQHFDAVLEPRPRGGVSVRLPFDPDIVWGRKDRHYVTGSIQRYGVRGVLVAVDDACYLHLGPSWCRDPRVGPGAHVSVMLEPEGPQVETMADDIRAALIDEREARRFFESLATFYRKGYVDWIEGAKRPDTRARRIAEAIDALNAGLRERTMTATDRPPEV